MLKVNHRNTRKMGEICSKLTIKTQGLCTSLMKFLCLYCFNMSLTHVSPLLLVFLLLIWNSLFPRLQACNFITNRLQHRCFPLNIVKRLRIPILKNISKSLLLQPYTAFSSNIFGGILSLLQNWSHCWKH